MKFSIYTGLVSLLALGLAACVTPVEEDSDARMAATEAQEREAGLVCEYEQIMGSLRRQRVCRTQEQIERSRAEAFRETDRIQRSAPGPSGG